MSRSLAGALVDGEHEDSKGREGKKEAMNTDANQASIPAAVSARP